MLGRLVRKELLNQVLDFRFLAVFALCAVLSVLSVSVGIRNYRQQVEQYQAVSRDNRSFMEDTLKKEKYQAISDIDRMGILWNRKPEALEVLVFGMAGKLGEEVHIRNQTLLLFEDSLFSVDPIHTLFGVLDFGFLVKVILSLCVLLLTFDSICGEKEGGTLRLYASFPVARSSMALAKLVGSAVAVLIPFLVSFLLASAVLALSPDLGLGADDWLRVFALLGVFALYLSVFAAFGLWVSGLTHRRMTAFLALLGLWTVWIFLLPNFAVRVAQTVAPVESFYGEEKQVEAMRWEGIEGRTEDLVAFRKRNASTLAKGDAMSEAERRQASRDYQENVLQKGEERAAGFYAGLKAIQTRRRNQVQRQQDLAAALSAASPSAAVGFVSMDLARTGLAQQARLEKALFAYAISMEQFVRAKAYQREGTLADFPWFTYRDPETAGGCLARNALYLLNLVLLAVLGFAGAYVSMLRYDVR